MKKERKKERQKKHNNYGKEIYISLFAFDFSTHTHTHTHTFGIGAFSHNIVSRGYGTGVFLCEHFVLEIPIVAAFGAR